MRVRMKVDVSGARNGVPWPGRGETVDLPDGEAEDLCTAGLAEPADDAEEEHAVVDDGPETAVAPDGDTGTAVPSEPAERRAGMTTETGPVRRPPAKKTAAKKAPAKKAAAAKPAPAAKPEPAPEPAPAAEPAAATEQ